MKENYIISGIQQIGIGVENFAEAWRYYIEVFNMDIRILEDDKVAELMLPYTGGKPQKRRAAIALNLQGGGGFEIWQYSDRKPKPADFEIQAGDLGVFAAKIKSKDVEKTYELFSKKPNINLLGKPEISIDGNKTFFMKDPYGNIFQIVHDTTIYRNEGRLTGGIVGAMIGVTDIEKAMPIYRDILGYDIVIADETGTFNDIKVLPSGEGQFRRRILSHSKPRQGSFSELFGKSYIELVQPLERAPRKIYEGRFWGDPGFIQICFDVRNTDVLRKKCEEMGYPFTVDSSQSFKEGESFDMGEAAGQFAYIEDPDGTLIELVEAHKIPLLKKLNLYLDLRKRDPRKPLSKKMLGMLRFMKVKPESL
ncbi:MAG: VOC family protein [Lascolabacillus sp.]|mgnify:CR=1 FL=1|jgi:catechol 2,3-dioxygenase-like lactoylglutathione lyase family enzyme|uniref:VOC family protein n=1 Tax=Lascolabacillus sp. TaxID=1924068 RepID=UPI00258CFD2A|nr:VOC family protein [Lascolabacillus sp.]MDD4758605.1 VOC family protein [Lascolabacillus sp.]